MILLYELTSRLLLLDLAKCSELDEIAKISIIIPAKNNTLRLYMGALNGQSLSIMCLYTSSYSSRAVLVSS